MLKKLVGMFKEPDHGVVKLSFIALDENEEPYEDVATMPWHNQYIQRDVEAKFTAFMNLRGHKVLEINILEVTKKSK